MQRILIILGHPDRESLCSALADAYEKGAKASGSKVRTLFSPIKTATENQRLKWIQQTHELGQQLA